MLFQAILVSSPGPCEPTCGLPLHETSLWVFHFDSDVLTTIICMVVNQTILSFELPSNLSYKSALQFQSLRINHFDLGSEIELYLLTFLISFPGSCEPIFLTSSPWTYPFYGLSSWFWCFDNTHLHLCLSSTPVLMGFPFQPVLRVSS